MAKFLALLRGVLLCTGIAAVAAGLQYLQLHVTGRAWLEALVLAILTGAIIRTFWQPPETFEKGIKFSAKTLLEVAIVLLGASLGFTSIVAAGPVLLAGILLVVALSLAFSYTICRGLGLPWRMAVLIASGNAICGNSAIAATAPVIGASPNDIATSIGFTAVLGIFVVLVLPLAVPLLHLSFPHYGILAGLTVFAVPQVLAATAPVSAVSLQLGTLVKLIRVLMLGPVILLISLVFRAENPVPTPGKSLTSSRLLPWFIVGFLLMSALRSLNLIPPMALPYLAGTASLLTLISMAALGLGVDIHKLATAGPRVMAAVTISLTGLILLALALITFLKV